MDLFGWLVVAALVGGLLLVVRSVKVVPQQENWVVERLGKYQRILFPGVSVLTPFSEQQVFELAPQPVICADENVVVAKITLLYRVVDPVRVVYEIADYSKALEQVSVTALRNIIGEMKVDEAMGSHYGLGAQVAVVIDEYAGRWGVKITSVEIKSMERSGTHM